MNPSEILFKLTDWLSRQKDITDSREPTKHVPEDLVKELRLLVSSVSYAEAIEIARQVTHTSQAATSSLFEGTLYAVYALNGGLLASQPANKLDYLSNVDFFKDLIIGNYPSLKYKLLHSEPAKIIPWITYPAIEFLLDLDLSRYSVIESGSGLSTLFFAQRCAHILSYETDCLFVSVLDNWLLARGINTAKFCNYK